MTVQRAPNFLIVGVTKSGTTFLAQALAAHQDVFFSRPKEPFFFNTSGVTESSFAKYLHDYFAGAGDQRWLGEGSTNYFHDRRAIGFIERFLGLETRIIVCLRHPVGRLISHYLHDYRKNRLTGKESLSDKVFESYAARSMYSERLSLWRSRFPHFQVQFFDDLIADGSAFYRQAANFLGIVPHDLSARPVNEGLRTAWADEALTVRITPAEGQVAPRFPREDLERMIQRFVPDIQRTMEMTGRDLSCWFKLPSFEAG